MGFAINLSGALPVVWCSISITISRAFTWGSAKTSLNVFIGPHPIFCFSNSANHHSDECFFVTSFSVFVTKSLLETRSALVLNFGSSKNVKIDLVTNISKLVDRNVPKI